MQNEVRKDLRNLADQIFEGGSASLTLRGFHSFYSKKTNCVKNSFRRHDIRCRLFLLFKNIKMDEWASK